MIFILQEKMEILKDWMPCPVESITASLTLLHYHLFHCFDPWVIFFLYIYIFWACFKPAEWWCSLLCFSGRWITRKWQQGMFWEHSLLRTRHLWACVGADHLLKMKPGSRLCLQRPPNRTAWKCQSSFPLQPVLGEHRKKLRQAPGCCKEGAVMREILAEAFLHWTLSQHHTTSPAKWVTATNRPSPAWPRSDSLREPMLAVTVLHYLGRARQVALARNQGRKTLHSRGAIFHLRWHVMQGAACVGREMRCAL